MGKVDKVVVVVLDDVSAEEFKQHGDSLPTLKSAFDIVSSDAAIFKLFNNVIKMQ